MIKLREARTVKVTPRREIRRYYPVTASDVEAFHVANRRATKSTPPGTGLLLQVQYEYSEVEETLTLTVLGEDAVGEVFTTLERRLPPGLSRTIKVEQGKSVARAKAQGA